MVCQESANTDASNSYLLDSYDQWIPKLDLEGFRKEILELGTKLKKNEGPDDVRHLHKIILWSNLLFAVGYFTMWWKVNLVSIVCLALFTTSRWTMVAHHTCHGGYEKNASSRYSRFTFGLGFFRRVLDWFDWFLPEAWNVEHNNRHHYCLGEKGNDPDLVEHNLKDLRESKSPKIIKYAQVFFAMITWKWYYYAPNTYKQLVMARLRRNGNKIPACMKKHDSFTLKSIFSDKDTGKWFSVTDFFSTVVGPYFVFYYFLLPLPYLLLGNFGLIEMSFARSMFYNSMINLAIAELLNNVHSFVIIVTNHAGDDMYQFSKGCRFKTGTFYLRQVISSVNFDTGNDICDFFHGWLNYQIEHHLWPNLSMLSYQRAQPKVKAICKKYGIPYVQENVFYRLKKTVDIMIGNTSMRKFPDRFENESDIVVVD